jgi:23S rRNA pseudouridine1911/1915/1917 synthase
MMVEPAVIYEDNHILVVIKEQGVPTVADSSGDQSLQEQLKECTNHFVGIVHRLDRVTGGVIVFARTGKAAARLTEQIHSGIFKKTYLAVIKGVPKQRAATLINYLAKDDIKNMVSVVPQSAIGAKRAELSYEIVEKKGNICLIAVNLTTGRSHQIRVQMKHIGHPIYGDARYGDTKDGGNIALWAYQLRFIHPVTGDELKFIVNPPEDGVWGNFDFRRKEHLLRGK